MKVNSILIAANNYPTYTDPVYTFLEQIVLTLSKMGVKVVVIAPYRIVQHYLRNTELHPKRRIIKVEGEGEIIIIQPRYITLGGRFEKFNERSARRAVAKAARKLKDKPDVCYGYFWHWGHALYDYAFENNIPLFVHTGETPVFLHKLYSINQLRPFIDYIKGVVCNSSFCKQLSTEAGLANEDLCEVFPNAIDSGKFYPREKNELRKQKGINKEDFVIVFTGWFDENKGANRLSEAITRLNDESIKVVFIGASQGNDNSYEPNCKGIIHKGRLPHDEVPEWLCASDVFVLPTQHEGSCNGIIEAMACGLPIISSDRMFNWDVLNENNSILIDPMNVDQIAIAIKTLKNDNQKRTEMSKASLESASELTIETRVKKIVCFIESKL